jgi:hypothetical protein
MLNRLVCKVRCTENMLWQNEIVGFHGLNLFFMFVLSELTIKYVIRFW